VTSLSGLRRWHPFLWLANARSDNPIFLAGRERIIEGMRIAVVPEG
jgi:hypothetical protein